MVHFCIDTALILFVFASLIEIPRLFLLEMVRDD